MTVGHSPPGRDLGCNGGCDLDAAVELAVERERRRLADALHDTTIQELVLARILVELASEEGCDDRLERVKGLLDDSLTQLRSLLWKLTPAIVHPVSWEAAIEGLGEQLSARWHLSYRCRVVGDARATLPNELAETLFLGARELMANAGRHAHASVCEVVVAFEDDGVALTVRDDGIGIRSAPKAGRGEGSGYGLCRLSSRVKQLGGALSLGRPVPGGTLATLSLPIKPCPSIRAATPDATAVVRR